MDKKFVAIANAIEMIVQAEGKSVPLDALAKQAAYDQNHFQKIFTTHVGISPKKLQEFLSYKTAREFLLEGHATLDAAYQAGLSGNGRLHDLFLKCESMTPGEVKTRGAGLEILWGVANTSLGRVMIAETARGICWLGFEVDGDMARSEQRMRTYFPMAQFKRHDADIFDNANKINHILTASAEQSPIKLDIYGTNFQIQVWRALLQIPIGCVVSYQMIAEAVGNKKASRAVGTAVGSNPISFLIPCHRVIQSSGIVENYGWGTARKKILLGIEAQSQNDKKSSIV